MMPGKRILVVSPQPFYEDRGTPIAVRRLLEAIHVCGMQADLLSFPIGRAVELAGVKQYRCRNLLRLKHVPIGLSWRKVVLDMALVPAVRRRLRSGEYSCVHALEEAAFFCIPMARRAGLPIVYDMQSSMPEQLQRFAPLRLRPVQAFFHACERWLLRRADFVMCSEGLAEKVRASVPQARVREWRYATQATEVAPQLITELRQELGVPSDARTVVYTGTFEHYQGLQELVAAVPKVCAAVPNAVFILAGATGSLADGLRKQALLLGLNGHLKIIPRQPVERIAVYQQMADVLVSPRKHGGNTPLKVFDYLAAAKPIVATDVSSHTAVLDRRMAVLVEPGPDALAAGILSVLTEPARAAALVTATRELAEHICGWKPFVESIKHLFEEVHAHARKPDNRGSGGPRGERLGLPAAAPAPRLLHHPRA